MIIRFEEIDKLCQDLHLKKKRIVLCHGVFDLLHYGHLKHLEESKKLGDILIVSTTNDKFINKSPKSPLYNQKQRSYYLDNISFVDFVVVTPYQDAIEIINRVKPNIYCKGIEYKDVKKHYDKNIINDEKIVKKNGGTIHYVGRSLFSTSKLLNNRFSNNNFNYSGIQSFTEVNNIFDDVKNTRVLVLGELIFDNYKFVELLGVASKSSVLSCKLIKEDFYFGGAGAVYNHLKNFVKNISLVSVAGEEKKFKEIIKKNINNKSKVFSEKKFKTICKQRYVRFSDSSREVEKLFSVNEFNEELFDRVLEKKILNFLKKQISKFDLVVICDYGHGFFTKAIINLLQSKSKHLSVNCQTNSYNYGINVLNKKYKKVDSFVLDQKEISLCFSKNITSNELHYLKILKKQLKAQYAWLTLGSKFSIGIDNKNKSYKVPALAENVIDPIGSGDAFFSISCLLSYLNEKINISTFISQLAGSIHVKNIANQKSIEKTTLLNHIKYYLKQ